MNDEKRLEEILKDAAQWEPRGEMPLGVERRALSRQVPPRRPIGVSYAATLALSCGLCFWAVRSWQPAPQPSPSPVVSVTPAPEAEPTAPPLPTTTTQRVTPNPPKRGTEIDKPLPMARAKTNRPSPWVQPASYTPARSVKRPKPVLVDAKDPVLVTRSIPVDEPSYTPTYLSEPTADGKNLYYVPAAMQLNDSDVIYGETP